MPRQKSAYFGHTAWTAEKNGQNQAQVKNTPDFFMRHSASTTLEACFSHLGDRDDDVIPSENTAAMIGPGVEK